MKPRPTELWRAEQVRAFDRIAIDELGIPGHRLMGQAGRAAFEALRERWPQARRIAVLCGTGNNGGDGYVIARHLHNQGAQVRIYAFKEPDALTGDAAVNAGICQRMGMSIVDVSNNTQPPPDWARHWSGANVIVDALLGTGFSGAVREPMTGAIQSLNALARPGSASRKTPAVTVLAVDVPSGLDCNSGTVSNVAVRADLTVTFVAAKVGFRHADARHTLGAVAVASIGAPPALIERVKNSGSDR